MTAIVKHHGTCLASINHVHQRFNRSLFTQGSTTSRVMGGEFRALIIAFALLCPIAAFIASPAIAQNPGIIQAGDFITTTHAGEEANASGTAASRVSLRVGEDLGYLVMGIVFVALGFITLLLTFQRSTIRDTAILLFGAMSCVWGVRFLLYTELVPQLLTGAPHSLQRLARGFTYFGASGAFGFALAYVGPGWRSSLRGAAYVSLAFSCVASLALLVNPDRDLLLPVFNVMILIGALTVIANILHPDVRQQPRQRGLITGFCVSGVFFVLENLRALGLVPVPFDVEWVGVLILYFTLGRLIAFRLFTNERRLASIRQELVTARQIQASLLPRYAPSIAGISMAARFVPMTEVAGDIYDFVKLDDCCLAILIADVSGHGVPAALIASMVKGAFRAQIETVQGPERVLAGMNRILIGQLDENFVTASCTIIDMESGVLRYSGAGHPPLLIQRKDNNQCISLQQNGLILGQFSDATYDSIERPLATGDRLLLYTDGILEAANANAEQFGDHSLHEFLAQHSELSAEGFADALLAAIGEWTSSGRSESLDDDLTLVVIDVQM